MRHRVIFLALVAGCFSASTAAAQQNPRLLQDPKDYRVELVAAGTGEDAKIMREDVEIFRRILSRAVQGWAGKDRSEETAGSLLARVAGTGHSPMEGNYLRGYGVVFTATLPWDSRNPVTESPRAKLKSSSEWERVRNELRGVKVEADSGKGQRIESLAEIVIKVLADNGRHFTQLGDNERVTVAITLRPALASGGQSGNQSYLWVAPREGNRKIWARDEKGTLFAPRVIMETSKDSAWPAKDQDPAKALIQQQTEAANFVYLGDQRLKQERLVPAAEAYEKAIASYQKLIHQQLKAEAAKKFKPYQKVIEQKEKPETWSRDLLDDLAALTIARTKLVHVYSSLGRNREAAQLVAAMAKDYESLTKNSSSQTPAPPAPKVQIGKLIISAPKRLLDQVGTGKLSMEEFKKQVSLDFHICDALSRESSKPTEGKSAAPAEKKH